MERTKRKNVEIKFLLGSFKIFMTKSIRQSLKEHIPVGPFSIIATYKKIFV